MLDVYELHENGLREIVDYELVHEPRVGATLTRLSDGRVFEIVSIRVEKIGFMESRINAFVRPFTTRDDLSEHLARRAGLSASTDANASRERPSKRAKRADRPRFLGEGKFR
jgi:hypothetical protein